MNIDFHSHLKVSQQVPFSEDYVKLMIAGARKQGLTALCVTEHYGSFEIQRLFKYITSFESVGDTYLVHDMHIFTGLEIDAQEGGHFLAIGSFDTVQAIYNQLAPYLKQGEHPTYQQIASIVKLTDALFGLSHPYRPGKEHMPNLPIEDFSQLDFIDLNGKDIAMANNQPQVEALSIALNRPMLGGSDTHFATQYGITYTHFEDEITQVSNLRKAIAAGKYEIIHNHQTNKVQVESARAIKKIMAEIHKAGADPLQIVCTAFAKM